MSSKVHVSPKSSETQLSFVQVTKAVSCGRISSLVDSKRKAPLRCWAQGSGAESSTRHTPRRHRPGTSAISCSSAARKTSVYFMRRANKWSDFVLKAKKQHIIRCHQHTISSAYHSISVSPLVFVVTLHKVPRAGPHLSISNIHRHLNPRKIARFGKILSQFRSTWFEIILNLGKTMS